VVTLAIDASSTVAGTDLAYAIRTAAGAAAPGAVVAVLLHHHVLPLPADHAAERLISWLGMPYADELASGSALLAALRGQCDLVLHGHRHTPRTMTFFGDERRRLDIYNAGSSTELGRVRVFCHEHGKVLDEPGWLWTWTETLAPPSRDQRPARIRGITSSAAGEARLRLAKENDLSASYS